MKQQTANSKQQWLILAIFSFLIFLFGCDRKVEPQNSSNSGGSVSKASTDGEVVLGEKIENPYSVKAMKKAYRNIQLINSKYSIGSPQSIEFDVRPTHYYVRLLPNTWAAYDTLKRDTTIFLVDIPIDVKVEKDGDYYHDPTIPSDMPTWQYTSVGLDYHAPEGVTMEVLDTLYLPDKAENYEKASNDRQLAIDLLENEALFITDNLTEEELKLRPVDDKGGRKNWFWNNWLPPWFQPKGTITVWDDIANRVVPVVGAKVRTWRFFDTGTGYVGNDGTYYVNNRYRYAYWSRIIWENSDYDIRESITGLTQAQTFGPWNKGDWNQEFYTNGWRDGINWMYSHMTRAMYRYCEGDIDGLTRPVFYMAPTFLNTPLKIVAVNRTGDQQGLNIGNWSIHGINPNIFIYGYSNGTRLKSDEIYSVTIHEVAHSTHWKKAYGGLSLAFVDTWTRESWATAVEWVLTQKEYKDVLGIANYGEASYSDGSPPTAFGGQQIPKSDDYSSVFIDLIDNFNQSAFYTTSGNSVYPNINDKVTGYSIFYIENNILPHVYGKASLKRRLKSCPKPSGVTDEKIDDLVNSFGN